MALKINDIHSMNGIGLHENGQIVGTIDKLEKKLSGEIPVTREELLVLVNSWGRVFEFDTIAYDNQTLKIDKCDSKEYYDLSKLDVSEITDMSSIFRSSNFNGDISSWNTSNVTDMSAMFYNTRKFNQPLNFDTSKVTNMYGMFCNARVFNQPLNFDTLKVTSMKGMFSGASDFNQPLNFDTSNVKNMSYMFYNITNFNQPLNFNTSNVISMRTMFRSAESFNQILNFDTSNVTNMEDMFRDAKAFQDKYNNSEPLPNYTNEIKEWFNFNRDKMDAINMKEKHGDEIDNFFSNFSNNHLLTECNKQFACKKSCL